MSIEKALVLGAQPPFEGPVVDVRERREWDVVVETIPPFVDCTNGVQIMVEDLDGNVSPLAQGENIVDARTAKACVSHVEGLDVISIKVLETKDEDVTN